MSNPQFSHQLTGQYEAKQARAQLADLYASDPLKACRLAIRRTKHLPEQDRLEAINQLLGMHGTEGISGEWQNGYWCNIVAAYCNTGETYALTVMQVRADCSFRASKFIVSSFGDWIEKHGEKMGVQ